MGTKSGISSLNRTITGGVSRGDTNPLLLSLKDKFISARVKNIILDESSENFEDLGGWPSVGTIQFEIVDYQTPSGQVSGIAYPLFPSIKNYPLIEEVVFLIKLPGKYIGEYSDDSSYYYMPPVSIWNHPHHNANPNQVKSSGASESQTKSNQQIEAGSTNKPTNSEESLDFNGNSGGTFSEKSNIHPLLPFAGDVLFEGRFGNSIRLGNTSKTNSQYANIWSDNGDDGDPITIIRNGQPEDSSEEGWLPITEDINNDISSITLTSTQKLPLELDNENYEAFDEAPIKSPEYTKNQIVLNSGRLIFNAKSDSVLLSANDKISLTSNNTIGLSSNSDITLNSSNVRLGSKEATERLVLGDSFMQQFSNLLEVLKSLASTLTTKQIFPLGAPVPDVPVIAVAQNMLTVILSIKNTVDRELLVSKVSKTD